MTEPKPLSLSRALGTIRLLSLDVDGVLTDGGLYYDSAGVALLRFYVQDGNGIKAVMAAGIEVCFITQSHNPVIKARASALGIHHLCLGVDDKLSPVKQIAESRGFSLDEICHVADDINDLTLLEAVGTPVTVANGTAPVRAVAKYITQQPGGHGAVREVCDALLASKTQFKNA